MNASARLLTHAADRWSVAGTLDFAGVSALAQRGRHLVRAAAQGGVARVTIDLAGVEWANSAALALLLDWLELARSQGVELRYEQLPEGLVHLASLSNLVDLLVPSDRHSPSPGTHRFTPGSP